MFIWILHHLVIELNRYNACCLLLLQYAIYRYVYSSMLTVSTQQHDTVQYKAVCCRSVHKGMVQFWTQHYVTRQYTRVCYRPDKNVCYISVHNSMLLFSTQQYAAGLHTTVRCRTVHNSMLHVSTQEYATGLTWTYATDLYTTVCYCSERCSTLRLYEPTSFVSQSLIFITLLHSLLYFSLIVRSTSLETFLI
jgi:hypothetical protein